MKIQFEIDESKKSDLPIPYFEDATASFAPYYTVGRHGMSEANIKLQISEEINKLNGDILGFQKVTYDGRFGYMNKYSLNNAPGVIHVAGLPIKYTVTEQKKTYIRVQALCNVRDWLKNAVTAEIFSPGCNILASHLLVPGSTFDDPVTISQYVMQRKELPILPASSEEIIIEK